MTDHPKSRRVRIIAGTTVSAPAGRGFVEYPPGWTGPVPAAVAEYLEKRPDLAEVWRDGEPPAPGQAGSGETESTVRVVQTEDGPRFEDVDEPPPLDDFEGLEGREA
jgi:hypothetical protein